MVSETSCGPVQALLAQGGEREPMVPMQCRAARALLQWTQKELAARAGVSPVTINGFESGITAPTRATLTVLRQALEQGGVEFLNDDQPGVRIKGQRK